jgi:hypothetical protein
MSFEIQDSDDDFSVTSPTRPGEEDGPPLVTIAPEVVASRSESTNETTSTGSLSLFSQPSGLINNTIRSLGA